MHGVCVGSWERFAANVVPHALGPVVGLSGQTSIADAYNAILRGCKGAEPDLLILQHDDLEITDPDVADKLAATLAGQRGIGLIGVAGARDVGSIAWWNYQTVGHQMTDGGLIDFGQRAGDVDALDGSFLAFTPWAIRFLRFDSLPGFHGYDVLICRKVRRRGLRVVVADIDTHHHSSVGWKSDEVLAEWQAAERFYQSSGV